MNKLDQLKKLTSVVADTGDFSQIEKYKPQDVTTNPTLILKAVAMGKYSALLNKFILSKKSANRKILLQEVLMDISIDFGVEILKLIPGRVSTEVDPRLSFSQTKTITYARKIIKKYEDKNIPRSRILVKIAATWEGIKSAKVLQQEGINCNLTLVFDLTQAIACAENNVYLISPFVGRITDWYMKEEKPNGFSSINEDPGVISVKKICSYYKKFNYKTIIMGASFRTTDQVEALACCDALTVPPVLLEKLMKDTATLTNDIERTSEFYNLKKIFISEENFRWNMNKNLMATNKLAEGINSFSKDVSKLEKLVEERL